uniref:Uncharacterized protein n=1 Tax=uncultured bacterium contig00104 TaxID=1181571 RepID=A0A806KLZ6_9BACT|nr:hypothetical protein [uncultured bacterium contig00104]
MARAKENWSIKATEKSLELYNKSFEKIQTTFSIFVSILGLFTGFLAFLNFKHGESLRKEIKDELDKIKKLEDKLDLIKAESEKIKKDIQSFKSNLSNILEELGYSYFERARTYFRDKKMEDHFRSMSDYFYLYVVYKIELGSYELNSLKTFNEEFIKEYNQEIFTNFTKDKYKNAFFHSLDKFRLYCEEMNKKDHLKMVEDAFKELHKIYGENEISKIIKYADRTLKVTGLN